MQISPLTLAVKWISASKSSLIPTSSAADFWLPFSSVAPLSNEPVGDRVSVLSLPSISDQAILTGRLRKVGGGGGRGQVRAGLVLRDLAVLAVDQSTTTTAGLAVGVAVAVVGRAGRVAEGGSSGGGGGGGVAMRMR